MSLALLQTALMMPAELLLNQLLTLDAASDKRLAELEGSTLALHVTAPELNIFISIRQHKLHLSPVFEGTATASLHGSASALLRILVQQTPVTNLAPFKVELQGSTAFVQALQNLRKELDVDWEFHLSRLVGDLPVAGLRKSMEASHACVARAGQSTLQNIQEYLAYESTLLPSQTAAEQCYTDINELTLRADRLQAKLALQQNH